MKSIIKMLGTDQFKRIRIGGKTNEWYDGT